MEGIKVGSRREKMDRENRAKQFMPFDALKGLREALAEKERILVPKRELSEEQKEELDQRLKQIQNQDMITLEFFQSGEYVRITGMVCRIQETSRLLEIANTKIAFDDISELKKEVFQE